MADKVSVCGIKNSWGWRIIEKTWWKTVSTAWTGLFAQHHTGTDKNCCMASQQHSLPSKGRQHLVGWKTTDLTPVWLSLHTGFLNCNIFLIYWPLESRRHWSKPPHTHMFSLHFHNLVENPLNIIGKETANLFKNIIWQQKSYDTCF